MQVAQVLPVRYICPVPKLPFEGHGPMLSSNKGKFLTLQSPVLIPSPTIRNTTDLLATKLIDIVGAIFAKKTIILYFP